MLPERTQDAEDTYLEHWRQSDDTNGLIAAITDAIEQKRPQLGARLVGLLSDHVEIEPGSALAQAQRASRMLMLTGQTPAAFEELQDAWFSARRMRIRRITQRMRSKQGQRRRTPKKTRR